MTRLQSNLAVDGANITADLAASLQADTAVDRIDVVFNRDVGPQVDGPVHAFKAAHSGAVAHSDATVYRVG